jgi:hypothetical protein
MPFNDDNDTILPLVPEVHEVEKERMSSFRVYSVPGDANTTRYDFSIAQLDGTEGVRPILHWILQLEKLRMASNHVNANTMEAWNNVVVSLLHDPAKSSYEQNLVKVRAPAWLTAKQAAYDAAIAAGADPDNPTGPELAAAQAAFDALACPAISLEQIGAAQQEMVRDLVPTGTLRRVKRYMRRGCRKPADMKIRIFINHLTRMNISELPLLPPFQAANSLGNDEITEIIQYAIPNSWNKKLREQGKDPLNMRANVFLQALEDLESSETDFEKASTNSSTNTKSSKKLSNKKSKKSNKTYDNSSNKENSFYCLKHGKNATHGTDDCHVMKKLATSLEQSKSKNKTWTKKAKKETTDSKKELAAFIAKKVKAEVNAFGKDKAKNKDKKRKAELNAIDLNSDKEDDGTVSLGDFDYEKLEGMSFNDDESFKTTVEDE